ncbi:MAG: hypothetical protein R3321_12540, partial [Nitrososphaeraceae archaeon]|nr:hypothetical protein [Nitrososphaeraceae archaeon]
MQIEKCPIDYVPYTNRDTIWIKPKMVVEIKFNSWTRDKIMKSPIFERIREDKLPQECFLEKESLTDQVLEIKNKDKEVAINNYNNKINNNSKNLNNQNIFNNQKFSFFSNLDKVYWSKTQFHNQIIKKDLIEYYDKISRFILPYIKNRPLSLNRYPEGIHGNSFYHKNWDQSKPTFVQTVKILSKSSSQNSIHYIICNNKETLL